jgi:hypothetical protein
MTHLSETIKPIKFVQTLMTDEIRKAITKEHLQENKKENMLQYTDLLHSNHEQLHNMPQQFSNKAATAQIYCLPFLN